MASKKTKETKEPKQLRAKLIEAKSTQNILLSDILVPQDFNSRSSLGSDEEMQALSESIRTIGMQQPVLVHELKGGQYMLVAGFRRVQAAANAGLDSVPARVYPSNTRTVDKVLLNLQENVSRKSLNPMEEARGANSLLQMGMSEEEVCAALGWTSNLLTRRVKLLALPECLQIALAQYRITETQAKMICELPAEQHARFASMAESLTTGALRDQIDAERSASNPDSDDDTEDDSDNESADNKKNKTDNTTVANPQILGSDDRKTTTHKNDDNDDDESGDVSTTTPADVADAIKTYLHKILDSRAMPAEALKILKRTANRVVWQDLSIDSMCSVRDVLAAIADPSTATQLAASHNAGGQQTTLTPDGTIKHPDGRETYSDGVTEVVRDASGNIVEDDEDGDADAQNLLL